jgi:colanic acid biosynthesis glycosyl transferase WcaI
MNKRLLLIGGNFHPEPIGIGKYNGEMIDFLAKQGYQCSVITSYPYYPDWKIQEPYSKYCYWYKRELKDTGYGKSSAIEIFRCPQYVPSKPTGKRRILLDISFCITASIKVTQLLFQKKYDVVIAVAPCFQVGLIAILYKKFKGAKFLYHIQDLQIDAARELKMIRSQMMINILLKIEKYILKKADTVSSISPAMIKKIKQKFERDIVFFPNWVNTSLFYPLQEKDKLKEEFSFNASDKIVLYSGAIGEKQGLEAIIDAAEGLGYISELKFIICGMGPYKEKLEQLKEKRNLKNLVFLPLQPTEKLNRF